MIVVCDTGPLLHLWEADCLDLLRHIGDVLLVPIVDQELAHLVGEWRSHLPSWLSIQELESSFQSQATGWCTAGLLHAGEAQALALAQQVRATWFLTDDAAARIFSESLAVETHGSLGVILWAAGRSLRDRETAEEKLERLFQSSLWVSSRVQQGARNALATIFP